MNARMTLTALLAAGSVGLASEASLGALTVTSGLQVHLMADAGVTESGGSVSAWESQAGNSLTLTQATAGSQPLLVNNVAELGGMSALDFSRTSQDAGQYLLGTLGTAFDANESTVFMVGSSTINRSAPYELRTASGTGQYLSRGGANASLSSDGIFVAHHSDAGATSTRLQTLSAALDTNHHILTTVVDKADASIDILVDGTNTNVAMNGSLSDTNLLQDIASVVIGARGNGVSWAHEGQIAEFIVFDRILSASEMDEVGYYLQEKYNLEGAFVPEPASVVLMGLGAVMLVRRRRSA